MVAVSDRGYGGALRVYHDLGGIIEEIPGLTRPALFVRADGGLLVLLPAGLAARRAERHIAALLFDMVLSCCCYESVVTAIGQSIELAIGVGVLL